MAIRDLLKHSEQTVKDLERSLAPIRKKLASQSPATQEEFKQKEKLVSLIKEQLQANKNSFDSGDIVAKGPSDPNAGILANKIGTILSRQQRNSFDWRQRCKQRFDK